MIRKVKSKSLYVLMLVLLLVTSQFPIGAQTPVDFDDDQSNQILREILVDEEKSIEQIEESDDVKLTVGMKMNDQQWNEVREHHQKLLIVTEKDQKLVFDKHQHLVEEDGKYYLDFKDDFENPEYFEVSLIAEKVLNEAFVDHFDFETSPIFELFEEEFKEMLTAKNQAALLKEEGKEDVVESTESLKEEAVQAKDEERKPEDKESDQQEHTEKEETVILPATGEFYLEIEDDLDYQLRYSGNKEVANEGEISKKNPIKFDKYEQLRQDDLRFDMFNKGQKDIRFAYKVKLDQKTLDSISEETIHQAIDFVHYQDGKQTAIEINNPVGGPLRFSRDGSHLIGKQQFAESWIDLNEQGIPYYHFTEKTESVKDEELNVDVEEYMLQKEISIVLTNFIQKELEKGESLESVKESLAKGVTIKKDSFKIEKFRFSLMDKDELAGKVDYPFTVENFMGMGQSMKGNISVLPSNGIHHELTTPELPPLEKPSEDGKEKGDDRVSGLEEIEGGFKLTWQGVANTDRKEKLDKLNLTFNVPDIVKRSGIENWTIQTNVELRYDEIKNNGEREIIKVDGKESQVISLTENSLRESVDLSVKDYVGLEYTVTQTYINKDLKNEVEGDQSFGLTADITSSNYHPIGKTITKKYPDSFAFFEITKEHPGTIGWSVHFNQNKVSRNEGEGFRLDIADLQIKQIDGDVKELDLKDFDVTVDNPRKDQFKISWDDKGVTIIAEEPFLQKEVFNIRLTLNLKDENGKPDNHKIKEMMKGTTGLVVEGKGDLHKLNSNNESSTPNGISPINSSSLISLVEKEALTIDYRTNEIIWGVKINTGSKYNMGLEGLTYYDQFSKGLQFSPFESNDQKHNFILYKFKDNKSSEDVNALLKSVEDITKSETLPNDQYQELTQLQDEKIDIIQEDRIFVLDGENKGQSKIEGYDVVFSQPEADKLKSEDYPGNIIDSSEGMNNSKSEHLSKKDFRLDFIASNKIPSEGDNNTYYLIYKTKVDSETPIDKVTNEAGLMYADYNIGDNKKFVWLDAKKQVSKEIEGVGQYHSIPFKSGEVKEVLVELDENHHPIALYDSNRTLVDGHTIAKRHAAVWTIRFNHNVDVDNSVDEASQKYNLKVKLEDVIEKTNDVDEHVISNHNLMPLKEQNFNLRAYELNKKGELSEVQGFQHEISSKDITWREDEDETSFVFETVVSPQYVYSFDYVTVIDPGLMISNQNEENKDQSVVDFTGSIENKVKYQSKIYTTGADYSELTEATAKIDLKEQHRHGKTNELKDNTTKQVLWTLKLNEGLETLENLVITDTLIGKHTFKNRIDFDEITSENDLAHQRLDNFKISTIDPKTSEPIPLNQDKYTLKTLKGDEEGSLDDWITGESGFILEFHEVINDPIIIQYASYGQAIHKKENIITNQAKIEYDSSSIKHEYTVESKYDFEMESTGDNQYHDTLHDLTLHLKYDENKIHPTSQVEKGAPIQLDKDEKVHVVLYRYAPGQEQQHYIYRAGKFNEEGQVTFANLEEGKYIVKQLRATEDYHVPNTLGFILDRQEPGDKSLKINQANAKDLIYVDVKMDTTAKIRQVFTGEKESVEAAIFNLTPTMLIKNVGVDRDEDIKIRENTMHEGIPFTLTPSSTGAIFKTDKDGQITLGDGMRYVTELSYDQDYRLEQNDDADLQGYLLNKESVSTKMTKNKNGTLKDQSNEMTFKNYKVDAHIQNIDRNDPNKKLKGATFALLKEMENKALEPYTNFVSKQKTKENLLKIDSETIGLEIYNLEPGTYHLQQIEASSGYLINKEPLKIDVPSSHDKELEMLKFEFENVQAKLSLTNILKTSQGQEEITNTTFEIVEKDDKTNTVYSLKGGDSIAIAPGDYILKQVKTQDQLPRHLAEIDFSIPEEEGTFDGEESMNTRTLVFENHLGQMHIERVNHLGETFDVKSFILDGEETVSEHQHEIYDLRSGEHKLEKISIDENFIYVDTKPSFTIVDEYEKVEDLTETLTLYATQAQLSVQNVDGDQNDQVIENSDAQFSLKQDDQSVFQTSSSLVFENVRPGKYALVQDKAPSSYGRNSYQMKDIDVPAKIDEKQVTLNKEKMTVAPFEMEKRDYPNYRGKVRFKKISSETGEGLEGIRFNLYQGEKLIKEDLRTDEQGFIDVNLLSPGMYSFVEIESDENHLLSQETVSFTIADVNENAYPVVNTDTLENHYALVKFKNTNPSHDEIYHDAQFKLEKRVNDVWEIVEKYESFGIDETLDEHYFTMEGLAKGSYRLTQVLSPKGTIQNEASYVFEITDEYEETLNHRPLIVLDDYLNYQGEVTIDVVDPYGKVELDVKAQLKSEDTQTEDMVSDQGQLHASKLRPGTYHVDIVSVDGAIMVDEALSFKVPEKAVHDEGIQTNLSLRVTYAYQDIQLIDGFDDSILESGMWQLSQDDQSQDYRMNGQVLKIRDLKPGTYHLQQTEAADSYILNSLNETDIEVSKKLSDYQEVHKNENDYPIVVLESKVFMNYKQDVLIEKVDQNGEVLSGVGFSLNEEDITYTDKKGQILYEQRSPGIYNLQEIESLEGYEKLDMDYQFEIASVQEGEPEVIKIRIMNKEIDKPVKPEIPTEPEKPILSNQEHPLIPGLGISNNHFYLALFFLLLGFAMVLKGKFKKHE